MHSNTQNRYEDHFERRRQQRFAAVADTYQRIAKIRDEMQQDANRDDANQGIPGQPQKLTGEQLRQLYSEQKDAAERLEREGAEAEKQKQILDVSTPWMTLIRLAEREEKDYSEGNAITLHQSLQKDPYTRAALAKAVSSLSEQTGLDTSEIQDHLLTRLLDNRVSRRSPLLVVRFFRDADVSWLAECPHCGTDNELPWDYCANCGYSRDGQSGRTSHT
jgi:hypothetical protein